MVTDHQALEFFKTQRRLTSRQTRWMEYLSRFDFDIRYIKGELNKGADCLSRYYETDEWDEIHEPHHYVTADIRLDPNLEDIAFDRRDEVIRDLAQSEERLAALRRSARLRNAIEPRDAEVAIMDAAAEPVNNVENERAMDNEDMEDPTIFHSRPREEHGQKDLKPDDELRTAIKSGYAEDMFFAKIIADPTAFSMFSIHEDMIYTRNRGGEEVLCVPDAKVGEYSVRGRLIEQAHESLGHFGPQRSGDYLRRWYWWPGVSKAVHKYCDSCVMCKVSKTSNQPPTGKLHSVPIPTQPWESISMDFLGPFPKSKGYDYVWVVMCRLTSEVHLIPVNTITKATELSHIYIREIVRLHGLPRSIVSDRDSKFTSAWWREIHRLLGAKLLMSTSFHPQTDGATERVNRSVGQILRSVVSPDQKDWVDKLPLVEFAINSSINASTEFAPFELARGYMPFMIREYPKGNNLPRGVRSFAEQALRNLAEAHDAIIAARVFSTIQANKHRSAEPVIEAGMLVYLSTKNLSLPKGRAGKLLPKYVGPYKVQKAFPHCSDYELELPEVLASRRVHNRFHVSLLRPYVANCDNMFPNRSQPGPYDFGAPAEDEWQVDAIIAHRWSGNSVEFHVRRNLGDMTWEPFNAVKLLSALDDYYVLHGVKKWQQLSKKTQEDVSAEV
jgi:hypothetical protein